MGALGAKRRERKTLSDYLAVVSIGTNSTRVLVTEKIDSRLRPVLHRSIGTRLGANLKEAGPLDPDGVARTLAAIEEYVRELRRYDDALVGAIATSAMRRASDGERFRFAVEERLGVSLEILSGEREAELSFTGATANRKAGGAVGVLDVGGGSAEYAYGREKIERSVSCEIGAVRLSEAIPALLGATVPNDIGKLEEEARAYARERLAPLRQFPRPEQVLTVGGTMFNAAAIASDRDRDDVDGVVLTRETLAQLACRFLAADTTARRAQPRISPQRADIFPAGLLIVDEALGLLDVRECTISQMDLLYGYLVQHDERG